MSAVPGEEGRRCVAGAGRTPGRTQRFELYGGVHRKQLVSISGSTNDAAAARSIRVRSYRLCMQSRFNPVAQRVELAGNLASILRDVDGDGAVVLFGSSARGDATVESDLDLLVICTRRGTGQAARALARATKPIKVSLVTHTWSSFERLCVEDWLFVRHLREEALTLWDSRDEFARRCEVIYPGGSAVIEEIRRHARGLAQLTDVGRYGSDFLFPLANVYALTKRIAMLANSRHGVRIFARDRALQTCGELYPSATEDLATLRDLAPFYALTRGIRSMQTPFSSDHAGAKLLENTTALAKVVETVCA